MNTVEKIAEAEIVEANPAEIVEQPIVQISDPMVSMIERVVLDPNASIEKLEKMLDMKERLEDRALEAQARVDKKAYFAAMAKCQTEMPVVQKNLTNKHTRSRYADLAAIEAQAMPIIHQHGFSVSFRPDGMSEKGELRILWTVAHEQGHVETGVAELPVDNKGTQGTINKTAIQSFGSTTSYGRRYLLCMLFNIATGDDNDGNAITPNGPTISEEQFDELRALIEEVGAEDSGAEEGKFCKYLKVNQLPELAASRFNYAVAALRKKIAMQKTEQGADQ